MIMLTESQPLTGRTRFGDFPRIIGADLPGELVGETWWEWETYRNIAHNAENLLRFFGRGRIGDYSEVTFGWCVL